MGGVATMSAEYMRRRVKAQMQDGDYVQLWQQMSNAPVPDRLALVKRNFDTTVDWEHFGNVWLEMFADEESNDVNLWKLVEHEQICAVINCLKDKQDAIQAAQQQQGKKQRSSTRGAYGGQSSQPSSWLKPTPKPPPKKRARGGAILVPKSAADAWITKRIEEGLIRGPEDITLPHHFRCSAMGYKAFFTMAYFPLRHFNKPYRCSQAVLMSATTMTLDQLGIEYKVPTTDKNGVCIFSSGDDFVQVNKALQEATGSGSDFLLRKINISSWEVFLQKEGVFILTSRYYENPEDREELEQCEYLPHYVAYNASLRMFYGQNQNYFLEPDDVANIEGVESVMKVLLQETGVHIPNYGAKANMNRQLYIKA